MTVLTKARTDIRGQPDGPVAARLTPDLLDALEDLDPAEQALISRLVRRAKQNGPNRIPIDELTVVNEFLKIDPEHDDFSVFETITTYKAPPP
jgi:hypothetical protein